MSELDPTTLRRELLVQEGIDQQLDKLVKLATETVLKLPTDTGMEESQLRNLLNASIESGSIEVVANFVRYQVARRKNDWQATPSGFAHTVINNLYKALDQITEEAVKHAQDRVRTSTKQKLQKLEQLQDSDEQQRQELSRACDDDIAAFEQARGSIHVRVMKLYLGYLNRAFYFYKKSQDRHARDWSDAERNAALESLHLVLKQQGA